MRTRKRTWLTISGAIKNGYGRHWISRPMRIVAPILFMRSFFLGGLKYILLGGWIFFLLFSFISFWSEFVFVLFWRGSNFLSFLWGGGSKTFFFLTNFALCAELVCKSRCPCARLSVFNLNYFYSRPLNGPHITWTDPGLSLVTQPPTTLRNLSKIVSVLLSASIESVDVSRMQEYFWQSKNVFCWRGLKKIVCGEWIFFFLSFCGPQNLWGRGVKPIFFDMATLWLNWLSGAHAVKML